jgi:hypothetical protein
MKTGFTTKALTYLLPCIIISAMLWVHGAAGYTFPVPWPDEAVFVHQAISIQDSNSLLTPYLSESRAILWMPPGYVILLGLIFKIFGSSLFIARIASFVLTISILGILAWMLRNDPARFSLLLLTGLFFLNRFVIILGNTARMEPLLILGVVAAMALLLEKKNNKAIALLFALLIIHPNAVYFLAAGLVVVLLQRFVFGEGAAAHRFDKITIVLVLALFAAYVVYAGLHWSDFLRDMSYQFIRKSRRNMAAPLLTPGVLVFVGINLAAVIVALVRKERGPMLFGIFALFFWPVNKIGQEMWYQVFDVFAILFLSIALIQLLNPARKPILTILLFLAAVFVNRELNMIESLRGYPHSLKWFGMGLQSQVDYFSQNDALKLRSFLLDHQVDHVPIRTKIYPSGDALLLHENEGKSVKSIYVAVDTSVFPQQHHDLFLVHLSRYSPIGWDWSLLSRALEEARIDTSDKRNLLFERDGTEQWYFRFAPGFPDSASKRKEVVSGQMRETFYGMKSVR